ncbi:MAG TPA: peroxidase family protein [Saprospiraceae bacterium]|nr:peroxidase family protein [Saprospiraceae bacterium]HMQ82814.1 peroxidase family protein [Saprospiraceae bacterium]
MQRRFLLSTSLVTLVLSLGAQNLDVQNYRTYDGSQNNLEHPDWGAAGTNLLHFAPIAYENQIDAPAGGNRPNPREISNSLFAQSGLINDPMVLSDYCWVWGQFIDHDFGLTPEGTTEPAMIAVPSGDPWFDPMNTGAMMIPMMRNAFDPSTGTDPSNPRRHPNIITAFIDGSGVYGSDEARANWLRTFSDGKLKVSAGNLLPFNTYTGEFDAPIDPNAPHMDNPVGLSDKIPVAGDPRAGENPLLFSIHTLFVREHNRLCDVLANEHPDWTDEQLYQHARKLVGGMIQSIVYNEWLPTMGVELPEYTGYKSDVNPQLMNVFTAAAFRLGHTLLNGNLRRLDAEGNVVPEGNLPLRDAFFNPFPAMDAGIEVFLKGMAEQTQQSFDPKVIDDVRNFLFGPPGAGGLDLAAININRGRERGLPDFNTVREAFGLTPYSLFQQFNPDAAVFTILLDVYGGHIDRIDPWVGFLSEKPMNGKLLGPTLMKVMEVQFTALRDGDRFFYENDPVLSDQEKTKIRHTSMHDIIMRNTGITLMQDKVFESMPHADICQNMTADVDGLIYTETGVPVPNATVQVLTASDPFDLISSSEGSFYFIDLPSCDVQEVSVNRNDDVTNGVSTADLLLIQQHILGVATLDSPYKWIAADANRSGAISALDQIVLRKAILGISDEFEGNTSWRFVLADYEFSSGNPLAENFPEAISIADVLSQDMALSFVGIKVGDVNNDVDPTASQSDVVENRQVFAFQLEDVELVPGASYRLGITAAQLEMVRGFQFSLVYDVNGLAFQGIEPGMLQDISSDNFGVFTAEGLITSSWHASEAILFSSEDALFYLNFQALQPGRLSAMLQMNHRKTRSELYDARLDTRNLGLFFIEAATDQPTADVTLFQNRPNPFSEQTTLSFVMASETWAKWQVTDALGRVILQREGLFAKGYNEWVIPAASLGANGLYYYSVETANGKQVRKMNLLH